MLLGLSFEQLRNNISKMSIARTRRLRWMSDNKLKNRIKNENIQCKLEVAPMEDKIRETRLR